MSKEEQIEYIEFKVKIPKKIIDIVSLWSVVEKDIETYLQEYYDIDPSFSEINVTRCSHSKTERRIENACNYYGMVLNKRAIVMKSAEETGELGQALSKLSLKYLSMELGESFWVDEPEEFYLEAVYEEMIDMYFMILQLKK